MEWNCGRTAVRVTVLPVRAALSNFDEPEAFQNPGDLTGFEDREVAHSYATLTVCVPMNSPSSLGSPSSRSIATTSSRFFRNSSMLAPCECAPGHPGT